MTEASINALAGALVQAVQTHKDAEYEVRRQRDNLRLAERSASECRKRIGAAVRSLRGALDIPADSVSRRHAIKDIAEYIRFEDEGEMGATTRESIVNRLLVEAKASAD